MSLPVYYGFILVSVLSLAGCNYSHVKKESSAGDDSLKAQSLPMDFMSVQMAVLGPQCLRCHSSAGGNQGGLSLETYSQVRSSLTRIYYRSIEKKDMPPNPLTRTQFDLLKAWLEAGAPEKGGKSSAGVLRGPVNWIVIRDQVLKSSCLDCHSGKDAHGGLALDSVDVVRANIMKIFETAIVKQTMPLEPYAAFSESEKQALMKWISQGMPQ